MAAYHRTRRDGIFIRYKGRTQNIAAWAEQLGIRYSTLYLRIKRYKWTVDRAFTQPTRQHHAHA
jgi:transposase